MMSARSVLILVLVAMLPGALSSSPNFDATISMTLANFDILSWGSVATPVATWNLSKFLVCDERAKRIAMVDPEDAVTTLAGESTTGWPSGMTPEGICLGDETAREAFFTTATPYTVQKLDVDTGAIDTLITFPSHVGGIVRRYNETSSEWNLLVSVRGSQVQSYVEETGGPTGWELDVASLSTPLALSPDGTKLSAMRLNKVWVFDIATKVVLAEIPVTNTASTGLAFSADGSWVVVSHANGPPNLTFISTATWEEVALTDPNILSDWVMGVARVGTTGKFLVFDTASGTLKVLDIPALACPTCGDTSDAIPSTDCATMVAMCQDAAFIDFCSRRPRFLSAAC